MGKVLIVKGVDYSANSIEVLDFVVAKPSITSTIDGVVTIVSDYDVYYTTDGTEPSKSSNKYVGSFNVGYGTTIKAIAYDGSNSSVVASYTYNATLDAPTINITQKGVVTIVSQYAIHYTIDGTEPTASSLLYTEPFNVANGVVVKAISVYNTLTSSVSEKTAVVVEGVTYGIAQGSAVTKMTETDKCCISPWIEVNPGDSYTWVAGVSNEYVKAIDIETGGTGVTSTGKFCIFEAKADKETRSNYYNFAAQKTVTAGAEAKYLRATFFVGYAGYVVNNTTGYRFDYDGSAE